jgi:hypothetical protein
MRLMQQVNGEVNHHIVQNKERFDQLQSTMDQMQEDLIEQAKRHKKQELTGGQGQPSLVYLLGGIIIGCIAAVYMIKMSKPQKSAKKQGGFISPTNTELNNMESEKLC